MRKISVPLAVICLSACLSLALSACQGAGTAASPAPNNALPWQMQVLKSEIKDSLSSVESVTQYNGSNIDVPHTQNPDTGFVYLIIDVSIRKNVAGSAEPFDWQYLVVRDASGDSYQRLDNDTFLEQYQYTPRITGLELRLGEYSGWMCYEIPASAATGKLTLVYTAAGNQQEISLQK